MPEIATPFDLILISCIFQSAHLNFYCSEFVANGHVRHDYLGTMLVSFDIKVVRRDQK